MIFIISSLVLLFYDSNCELLAPLEKQIKEKCVSFCQNSLIVSRDFTPEQCFFTSFISQALPRLSFGNCSWLCRVEQCSNGCSLFSMDSRFECDKDCPVTSTACRSGCRTAESMYMYQVQTLLEKSQAVLDQGASHKIVLAWRLEPYDLSTLTFTNSRRQTSMLLLRIEVRRADDRSYELLNRNIGISPSLVTVDLPLDEVLAGNYEARLTVSYKQRRIAASKSIKFEIPGSIDLTSYQLHINIVQCLEPDRALVCWNRKLDRVLRVSLLKQDMTLIKEDDTNETCFLFTSLTSEDMYLIQISVQSENQQLLLAKDSVSCKFSSQLDLLRPILFYADSNQIYKITDVNDYHQSPRIVHDQEKVNITAFAVSRIDKSDVFFIATNDSQVTVKKEYKILAKKKFTGGAIRSILADQNEMRQFFLQTDYDIYEARMNDSDIQFNRIFKSKYAIKSSVLDTFTCQIYVSTVKRIHSLTLTTPVVTQTLNSSMTNCSLTIDLLNRQLLCHNGNSELFYYDLISRKMTKEKSAYLKTGAAKNYTNVRKMTAYNGTSFWLSSDGQCSAKNFRTCLLTDEFNPKNGFYVVNEYFSNGRSENSEFVDLALLVENLPPNLFPPIRTSVFNNGSRISSSISNQALFYFEGSQNCLASAILKTTLLSIDDQNRTTKIVQQSTDMNCSAISTTANFDMNPSFKDLNHTLMISYSICANGYCSRKTNSTYFRMLDLTKRDDLGSIYIQKQNSVMKTSVLGEIEQVWHHMSGIGSLFCGNISCFTIYDNGKIMEMKSDSTTVSKVPQQLISATGFRYDSPNDMLYWIQKNGIYHGNFDNRTNSGLLAIVADVKTILPIQHEPLIIICTNSQIISIMKTGGYYRQHFTCNTYNCEIYACTTFKSLTDNEISIICVYKLENQTFLTKQSLNNDTISDQVELGSDIRINQMKAISERTFIVRTDKNQLGTLDVKLNATNWFSFDDASDFCFFEKGSREKFTSAVVKSVNMTRVTSGLNISWTAEPALEQPGFFDITFREPLHNGLYHIVTNDSFLIIDEPTDQNLTFNISILLDYEPSIVQQFTLLVDQVAHYANLSAFSITPNCIGLLWKEFESLDLLYSVDVTDNQSTVIPFKENSSAKCQDTVCSKIVCHKFIKPATAYRCKIVGKTQQGVRKFETPAAELIMANLPGSLMVVNRTSDSLTLNWTSFTDIEPKPDSIKFFYKKIDDSQWKYISQPEDHPSQQTYSMLIKNLTSDAQYSLKYSAIYHLEYQYNDKVFNFDQMFDWTTTAATLPEKSVIPKMASVEIVQKLDGNFTLQWKLMDPKAPITQFIVMYRKNETSNWTSLVPPLLPTVTSVDVPKKLHLAGLQFNVFTNSSSGYGPDNVVTWSEVLPVQQASTGSKSLTFLILAAIFVILILSVIGGFFVMQRIRKKRRKMEEAFPKIAVAFTNRSYGVSVDDSEISASKRSINVKDLASLPHVPRSCVTISRQLGSGAFGEVFEGLAYNLPKTGQKTCRVAIKSLRLNHQNSEKVKFLNEAILMSSMDHKNIVSLLGVCIEREPQWLILDLMEGGDLLSFLRSSRPTTLMPSQLCLNDLLQMSHDVASGCAYLEKEHHVHRDLAARNCLLTSRDPELRVVKIGDFGMSRDVYEGDYYRVEGEGLLPVRWMAPESLIDGVFTVKTDVWSFGVLLWEIMSLGQQPYIGKSNFETMNFVRLGGRLEPPEACPHDIYQVMIQCWDSIPTNRKSFTKICDEILAMKSRIRETVLGEQPFPPNFSDSYVVPRDSFTVESVSSRRTTDPGPVKSEARVSASDPKQSTTFTRNSKNQSHRNLRHSGREKISKIFSSLRRKSEEPPPPVLPSKEAFDGEPDSRCRSESAMSFTTNATGYEVALLEQRNNQVETFDRFTNAGVDNYGYCSSTDASSTGYEQRVKDVPKTLVTEI